MYFTHQQLCNSFQLRLSHNDKCWNCSWKKRTGCQISGCAAKSCDPLVCLMNNSATKTPSFTSVSVKLWIISVFGFQVVQLLRPSWIGLTSNVFSPDDRCTSNEYVLPISFKSISVVHELLCQQSDKHTDTKPTPILPPSAQVLIKTQVPVPGTRVLKPVFHRCRSPSQRGFLTQMAGSACWPSLYRSWDSSSSSPLLLPRRLRALWGEP